tara:strand:+ start:29 stop:250 length:222 start_codon:yes stop_codon:yes gene_type:complete
MINATQHINNDIMGKKKKKKEAMLTGKEIKKYTVWVGGTEVTEHLVTYSMAKAFLDQYTSIGHKDVIISEYKK